MKILISLALLLSTTSLAANKKAGKERYKICSSCHGVDGKTTNSPLVPKLAGQNAQYLEKQLKEFAKNIRGNSQVMSAFARALIEEERKNIVLYLSELK